MALKSNAQSHPTQTISFNPYREPSAHPWEGGTSPQTEADIIATNDFNRRLGLGVGLSAFLFAIFAILAYGLHRRTQILRQRRRAAQRVEERRGLAMVIAEEPRPPDERAMVDIGPGEARISEDRTKQPDVHVHMIEGHERGESSSGGATGQTPPGSVGMAGGGQTESYHDISQQGPSTYPAR
jgi:hypothetical protein